MKTTKTMTLYHGSPNKFDQFEVRDNNNSCIEGEGVYLTDDIKLASGYGSHLYTVQISEEDINDFTDLNNLSHFMQDVLKDVAVKFDMTLDELNRMILSDYIGRNLLETYKRACESHISVSDVYKHALDTLENDYLCYMSIEEKVGMEEFSEAFEASYKAKLKPVVKYYDKSYNKNIYIAKDANKFNNSITSLYREFLS